MKKKIYLLIILLAILTGLLVFNYINKQEKAENEIILFYSIQCPHCKELEDFLHDNNIHAKINFVEKEVSQDKANVKELIKIMQKCNIPKRNYIEIPFLWTGHECLIGSDDIIKFFTEATK